MLLRFGRPHQLSTWRKWRASNDELPYPTQPWPQLPWTESYSSVLLSRNQGLSIFFKCLKGLYNFPIINFVKAKQLTRSTRNNSPLDMSVPLCKTKLFQTSYFNRIPKIWNNLTPSIRCRSSVSTFRSAVYNRYSMALKSAFCLDNPLSWKSRRWE